MSYNGIINDVLNETERQNQKWGIQGHPCLDSTLLNRKDGCSSDRMCEEYEIPSEDRAKQLCNIRSNRRDLTWGHIAVEELSEVISEFDINKRRAELVQLAAVCVNWIKSIDNKISNGTTTN